MYAMTASEDVYLWKPYNQVHDSFQQTILSLRSLITVIHTTAEDAYLSLLCMLTTSVSDEYYPRGNLTIGYTMAVICGVAK
jgi:hypothetical protein